MRRVGVDDLDDRALDRGRERGLPGSHRRSV
jgi:hypothetical protein